MATIDYYPDGYIEELNGNNGYKKFKVIKNDEWGKDRCDLCDAKCDDYCDNVIVWHELSCGGTVGVGWHRACEDGPDGETYLKEVPYSTPASIDEPMPGDMVRVLKDTDTNGDLVGLLAIISEKTNAGYSLIFKDMGLTAWWDREDFEIVETGPMHSYQWYEYEKIMPKNKM